MRGLVAGGYDLQQYLKDYDPAVWGNDEVASGPQEDARVASAVNQDSEIKANIPSNTTIVGVGKNSGILGGSLQIKGVSNVIMRNLTIEAPLDCFPKWDPTDDNRTGNWNSEYDAVVVYGTDHVWIDHNTFTDGRYPDSERPVYFGKVFQQHDGLTDIVRGANHVTVSWNRFQDHDKNMLIGNSDSTATTDAGKLKVTMHHNRFDGILQRSPRVRFGQVDVYNNHYVVTENQKSDYYIFGVGISSQLYASDNAISLPAGAAVGKVLKKWNEAPLTAESNYVNGKRTDLIAVHNAEIPEETLQSGAGWKPTLRTKVDSPRPCRASSTAAPVPERSADHDPSGASQQTVVRGGERGGRPRAGALLPGPGPGAWAGPLRAVRVAVGPVGRAHPVRPPRRPRRPHHRAGRRERRERQRVHARHRPGYVP